MSPSFRTLNSLKITGFRYYLGMFLCQMAVHDMRTLAHSLLIYRLTGSVALLGALSLANAVPGIILPLFGGVIADRIPKRYVLNIGQAGAAFASLIVAVTLSLGWLSAERAGSWWIVLAASFLGTSLGSLTTPASQAVISELVGKENIMNAVSLRSAVYNIMRMVAPAFAGVIIDRFDFSLAYYVMCAFSILAMIFSLFLPTMAARAAKVRGTFAQLKDGFSYARRETNILFIIVFILVVAILVTPYSRLMPVYVDDILNVGATGYGLLLSVLAIGGIVGSLVVASLPSKRRGVMLLIDVAVLGLALMAFAFSTNWYFSLAVMVLIGLFLPARLSLSNSLVQSYTDRSYQGRMMSLYSLQDGIFSLGGFLAAMAAGVIGTPWTVFSFALVMVLFSLLSLVFLPRIRKLD
ncbi:MAG: MFS transporter [Chloroflexota bacterium]